MCAHARAIERHGSFETRLWHTRIEGIGEQLASI